MADIVPIELGLDDRDLFTLWAPRWRDAGDEWEAFLGKDDDLYGFESVADLVAFVRSNTDNDLTDHPAWEALTTRRRTGSIRRTTSQFDLIGVYELLAEKPTEESVRALAGTLAIVSSIGSVCELPAVTKFFNGNPVLARCRAASTDFTRQSGPQALERDRGGHRRELGQRRRRDRRGHHHPRGRQPALGEGGGRTRGARARGGRGRG